MDGGEIVERGRDSGRDFQSGREISWKVRYTCCLE